MSILDLISAPAFEEHPFNAIGQAVRDAADCVCREHYGSLTQEPALTSRIAQAVEDRMRHFQHHGYQVQVVTQDVPDRGRDALEGKLGADLYVGIRLVRNRRVRMSKGFLVQAKLDGRPDRRRLEEQSNKMSSFTRASYVWIYTEDGVNVVRANEASADYREVRRLDSLITETLYCHEGDFGLAIPRGRLSRRACAISSSSWELGQAWL